MSSANSVVDRFGKLPAKVPGSFSSRRVMGIWIWTMMNSDFYLSSVDQALLASFGRFDGGENLSVRTSANNDCKVGCFVFSEYVHRCSKFLP